MGFPTRSDTNQAVQSLNMARGLKFRIQEVEGLYYPVAKTKALISFTVIAKLICVFVFAYAKIRFSYDAAHFLLEESLLEVTNITLKYLYLSVIDYI